MSFLTPVLEGSARIAAGVLSNVFGCATEVADDGFYKTDWLGRRTQFGKKILDIKDLKIVTEGPDQMPYKVSLAPETEKLLEEKIPLKAARERIEYWRTHRSYGSDPQGYMRYCPDNPRAFNYPTVQAINVYEVPNGLLLVDGKYEKLSECTFAHEKNAVFVDKGDSEVFVNRGAHIGRGDFSRMVEAPACRM